MIKHRILWIMLVGGVLTGSCFSEDVTEKSATTKKDKKTDMQVVVSGGNTFTLDLYKQLVELPAVKKSEGNLFFSPYSVSSALAMVWAGAEGKTERQMAETLHFSLLRDQVHNVMKEMQRELNQRAERNGIELRVANALWGQAGYQFQDEFLQLTDKYYGAGLEEVDYIEETEKSRKKINRWVEKKTKGKITDLVKPGVLNPLTNLILTNEIYFKGDWALPFYEKDTTTLPFTWRFPSPDSTTQVKKVLVSMMLQTDNFGYLESKDLQVLELPYEGKQLSMLVLLPKAEWGGLEALEKTLTMENLNVWVKGLRKREVRIYLPKFKATSEFSLSGVLKTMGMPDAFSVTNANFSGMNGKRDLHISAVVHKAFVEVNEKGTEAAAATAITVSEASPPPSTPPVFRADHPFLYLIYDNQTGSILFLGRMMKP